MLYRICGTFGSGKTLYSLDRVINSKYANVLILTTEVPTKKIQELLKNYKLNTDKIIINNITIKELPLFNMEILMDYVNYDNKYDCILIDKINSNINEDIYESLSNYSIENDIDLIITEQLQKHIVNIQFDEAVEMFSKTELEDNQEMILTFKSNLNNGTPFIKIYERRNNLIRTFNINQYLDKNENTKKTI